MAPPLLHKFRHCLDFPASFVTVCALLVATAAKAGTEALGASDTAAQTSSQAQNAPEPRKSQIYDEWTANVLPAKRFALGSLLEVGSGYNLMMGTDPSASAFGAKTMQLKWQTPNSGEDDWSVGMKYISISRNSLWWGDLHKRFSKLEAQILRPSISWSNRVSQRLIIHSFWSSGFGSSDAELSPFGKEELRKAKQGTGNSNDGHSFANRTMQLQSIAGFTEDRFQITAEWERNSGDRILLSTRFERTRLEQLDTFSIRLTLAQQWTNDDFNIRLGGGPQYAILSGRDLDGEEIKTAGWLPAADFALYWVL